MIKVLIADDHDIIIEGISSLRARRSVYLSVSSVMSVSIL